MFESLERNNIQAGITHLLRMKGLLNKEMGGWREWKMVNTATQSVFG